ncbi:hypothetical protein FDP41_005524 [Naegleria fowleri]|uniref:inorganic diphosphatase n=1 Tax=Naegleria fowleri TaxID=5763 RepID=A0A6A5BNK6_NAEFO|nr:uncharacterized protein FDP41_005524 [Naegleria fowleri]KAF0975530.1 hypothetical protein FDP41_005524 [Naegleria fowleri]
MSSQLTKLGITKILEGTVGARGFKIMYKSQQCFISPWHNIPLIASEKSKLYHYLNEIPLGTLKKMEVNTKEEHNPIIQDEKKGKLREFTYRVDKGGIPFNYGMLPQTWEDPNKVIHVPFGSVKDGIYQPTIAVKGDGDPLDVVEVSDNALEMGEVYKVKVFGILGMIDEGEMDWKVLAKVVSSDEEQASDFSQDIYNIPKRKLNDIIDWFRMYKTTDGKPENHFAFQDSFLDRSYATYIIEQTHKHWMERLPPQSKH